MAVKKLTYTIYCDGLVTSLSSNDIEFLKSVATSHCKILGRHYQIKFGDTVVWECRKDDK